MRNIGAIARRELSSFFDSPIAYVVIVFFLVLTAAWFFFIQQFFAAGVASLRDYFSIFPAVFVLLIPAITMRSWAEERKLGTDELLLTFPLKDAELVIGKYLSGLALLAMLLVLTVPIPLTVAPFGYFEKGQIVSEYLGVLFLGAAALAVGMLLSALSTNQITAFLLAAAVLLALTFVGQLPRVVALPGWLSATVIYVSIDSHFDGFRKGLLDSRDVVYFLVVIFLFLYTNVRVLADARRR